MPVLMDEILAAEGGWTGWRSFAVAERIRESSHITSFILTPQDGHPVLRQKPGQYLTFRLKPDGAPERARNSPISCPSNGEYYRI
ncbi:Flavohemoprotein (fragment) [Sphingomonas aurantiaca]|uniref:Flavohemoprotein n=1 Tax=Sphingomonas aurantiaca TaxID=185949 RepID=A0A5E7YEN9_9SPHN